MAMPHWQRGPVTDPAGEVTGETVNGKQLLDIGVCAWRLTATYDHDPKKDRVKAAHPMITVTREVMRCRSDGDCSMAMPVGLCSFESIYI